MDCFVEESDNWGYRSFLVDGKFYLQEVTQLDGSPVVVAIDSGYTLPRWSFSVFVFPSKDIKYIARD